MGEAVMKKGVLRDTFFVWEERAKSKEEKWGNRYYRNYKCYKLFHFELHISYYTYNTYYTYFLAKKRYFRRKSLSLWVENYYVKIKNKYYDTRTGQPIFEYKKPIIGYNSFTGEPIFEGDEVPKETLPKQPLTEEDKNRISNSILIITGAVLVVIASIIFLATGWETMHGLLKTLILFCIQMIFSLFAYITFFVLK